MFIRLQILLREKNAWFRWYKINEHILFVFCVMFVFQTHINYAVFWNIQSNRQMRFDFSDCIARRTA